MESVYSYKWLRVWGVVLLAISMLLMLVLFPRVARAAALDVNTTDDELNSDGDCSLREAIQAVNLNATVDGCVWSGTSAINLPAGTYSLTLYGPSEDANTTGDLDILNDLTLTGAGSETTIIDGAALGRVIDIDPPSGALGPTVVLEGVTIQNANATPNLGGGLLIHNGNVSLINLQVLLNSSGSGGGLANIDGTVTLTNTTVSENDSQTFGGGVYNGAGTLHVNGSTLDMNTTTSQRGGGIFNSTGTVTITESTVSGNSATTGNGGGIASDSTGTLTISASTIMENTAGLDGGGIANQGVFTIENSTISGNRSGDDGGGIHNLWTATTELNNVTIAENISGDLTGGVYEAGGTFNFRNSLFAGNSDESGDPDCYGTLSSQGYNLIEFVSGNCTILGDITGNITGQPAYLAPLADQGGPTWTHRLMPGSPATDAANPLTPGSGGMACTAADQRGVSRPQGAACDIGAFEQDLTELLFLPFVER